METDASSLDFWQNLEKLIVNHPVMIDRPKGGAHPRFSEMIYPLDYGYLEGTQTVDGDGIDVWLGSGNRQCLNGVLLTVDLSKQDAEIKLLLGCDPAEIETIRSFLHHHGMPVLVVHRKGVE